MMNPEIKALWLAALRNGEYAQGKGLLRQGDGRAPARFCCLGVLCELHAQQTGKGKWLLAHPVFDDDLQAQRYLDETGDTAQMELPEGVVAWSGLESSSPAVPDFRRPHDDMPLATLNDDGMPFPQIADLIEAHL